MTSTSGRVTDYALLAVTLVVLLLSGIFNTWIWNNGYDQAQRDADAEFTINAVRFGLYERELAAAREERDFVVYHVRMLLHGIDRQIPEEIQYAEQVLRSLR